MDDATIIELYNARDESAIAETTKKFGAYCRRIAMNLLRDESDAEECLNDALLKTWNSIPPAKPSRLDAYLAKITRNLALNRLRGRRAAKRGGGICDEIFDELENSLPAKGEGDPADSIAIRDSVNAFLKSLPEETRKIFMKRYWYMMSVEEIASDMGIGQSRVKTALMRARAELRFRLEGDGVEL